MAQATFPGPAGRRYVPLRCCSRRGLHRPASRHAAGELLPHLSTLTPRRRENPRLQNAVYFCCTFLEVAFTGSYPAPLPCGARTFLRYDLSVLYPRLSGLLNAISFLNMITKSSLPSMRRRSFWFPAIYNCNAIIY
jgi:hypothetical protein